MWLYLNYLRDSGRGEVADGILAGLQRLVPTKRLTQVQPGLPAETLATNWDKAVPILERYLAATSALLTTDATAGLGSHGPGRRCTQPAKKALPDAVTTVLPSMPAVLRPALRSVTRRTLNSALARDLSMSFCRDLGQVPFP